jgi:CRP-like cAMP-binding protein
VAAAADAAVVVVPDFICLNARNKDFPMNENVQFLKEHPVFHRLSEPYMKQLAAHMDVVSISPGEVLFREGEAAEQFFLVMEGTVDLFAHLEGDQDQWIQMIDVGEVIGWSWLVAPYKWTFSARSREGAMLMRFDAVAIRELCDRDPAFGYGTMKQICSLMLERLTKVRSQMLTRIQDIQKKA